MKTRQAEVDFDWKRTLAVMILCHGTATLLMRLIPTIAPEVVRQYGWSASFIGWIATLANLGSMLLIAGGTGVLRALGSIRAIRLGLLASAVGTLAMLVPIPLLPLVAGLVVGLGHGPTNPAGNDLLNRAAPPHMRGLIFSIKQSAVPLGGVLGGLTLPVLAARFGVPAAILAGVALAGLALYATRRLQGPVGPPGPVTGMFRLSDILGPLAAMRAEPELRRLALTGFLLSFVQSVWFVYLPAYLALSVGYGAAAAGVLYALMQGTSVGSRIALGWLADRMGSAWPLISVSLLGSVTATLALAAVGGGGPAPAVVALSLLGGLAVAGWNGVHLGETVRTAPPDRFYESVSGTTMAIGLGVVSGPLFVSALLDAGVDWTWALVLAGLMPLAGLPWTRWR